MAANMKKFLIVFFLILGNISLSLQCNKAINKEEKEEPLNRMCYELCNTKKGGLGFEGNSKLFVHDIYLVQLIEHPILRIPNILFVYFLSIFSR